MSSERDVSGFKLLDERIVSYILKRACHKSEEQHKGEVLHNEIVDKKKLIKTIGRIVKDCRTLLYLGEPDYITLYLKFYPIVTESFIL